MHFGTSNICGQIVLNTLIEEKLQRELVDQNISSFNNLLLKEVAFKILKKNNFDRKQTQLINGSFIKLNMLDTVYLQLLNNYQEINIQNVTEIEQSNLAWYENKSKHVNNYSHFSYSLFNLYIFEVFGSFVNNDKPKKFQNYAILYSKSNSLLAFGIIKTFFKIFEKIYCLVQKLVKQKKFTNDENFECKINEFYAICSLENEFKIIEIQNIKNKCVLLINKNDFFLSVCNQIDEHD
jgi:hypothetical protein